MWWTLAIPLLPWSTPSSLFRPLKLQTRFMLTPPLPLPIQNTHMDNLIPSAHQLWSNDDSISSALQLWSVDNFVPCSSNFGAAEVCKFLPGLAIYSVHKQLSDYHTTNLCQIILCSEKAVTSVDANSVFTHMPGGSYCRQFTSPWVCPLSYVQHQWTITVKSLWLSIVCFEIEGEVETDGSIFVLSTDHSPFQCPLSWTEIRCALRSVPVGASVSYPLSDASSKPPTQRHIQSQLTDSKNKWWRYFLSKPQSLVSQS